MLRKLNKSKLNCDPFRKNFTFQDLDLKKKIGLKTNFMLEIKRF